uniref:Uncharacterized protein n=1 Tax=Romanomermis culicivorax TaxID=13658 RepID=A0A915JNQ2_ROMCU
MPEQFLNVENNLSCQFFSSFYLNKTAVSQPMRQGVENLCSQRPVMDGRKTMMVPVIGQIS